MKKNLIPIISILLLDIALGYFAGLRNALIFTNGLAMGYFFVYGSVGFTSAWRKLISNGNPYHFYGQILMLGIGIIVILPLYTSFPTLTKVVAPLAFSSFIGAFLFGVGMQLGDGCGSGTLAKLGYNRYSQIVLLPLLLGSFIGTLHVNSAMELGGWGTFDLSARFGLFRTIIIQISILLIVLVLAKTWSSYKKWNAKFNWQEYKKLYISISMIALLSIIYLLLSGQGWGVSFGFGLWGTKIADWVGFPVYDIPYWTNEARNNALFQSVIFDTTSVSNFGIILGAWLTSFTQSKEIIQCKQTSNILGSLLGGFLMGYGAILAFGCNIGPYFSGIASGSLHGWSWLLFAMIGTIVGIKIRKLLGYK